VEYGLLVIPKTLAEPVPPVEGTYVGQAGVDDRRLTMPEPDNKEE
jgi:hypothetical protein